jgi:hypothetical protein
VLPLHHPRSSLHATSAALGVGSRTEPARRAVAARADVHSRIPPGSVTTLMGSLIKKRRKRMRKKKHKKLLKKTRWQRRQQGR